MTTDDAKPIIRTLRDVLLEARAYVADVSNGAPNTGSATAERIAAERLERIDAAIAEAEEVLT